MVVGLEVGVLMMVVVVGGVMLLLLLCRARAGMGGRFV